MIISSERRGTLTCMNNDDHDGFEVLADWRADERYIDFITRQPTSS